MRKSTVCSVAVLLCAWVSSFGQSNGLPQWKVVKEFHAKGQTSEVGPKILFTSTKDYVYRASMYVFATSTVKQNSVYSLGLDWIDQTGQQGVFFASANLNDGHGVGIVEPSIFSPKVGTPVRFFILASDPPPQDATYSFVFTIEKLTH